jgi:hypothetical protein
MLPESALAINIEQTFDLCHVSKRSRSGVQNRDRLRGF